MTPGTPKNISCRDGNRLLDCASGVDLSIDCAGEGPGYRCDWCERCKRFSCLPPGPDCDPNAPTRCDGDHLVHCSGVGRELSFDCTRMAHHCTSEGGLSRCAPDATECDPQIPARCEGDAVVLCVGGFVQSVPCTSLHLQTCAEPNPGWAVCE